MQVSTLVTKKITRGHSRNQSKCGRNSLNIITWHVFLTIFLSLYSKRVQKPLQRTLTAVTRGVFMLLMSTLRLQGRCSLSVKNLRFFIKITLNRKQNLSVLMRNMQILGKKMHIFKFLSTLLQAVRYLKPYGWQGYPDRPLAVNCTKLCLNCCVRLV